MASTDDQAASIVPPTPTCQTHDGREITVYCTECLRFGCQICAETTGNGNHQQHIKIDLLSANSQFLAKISNLKEQCEASLNKFNVKLVITRAALNEIDTKYCKLLSDTENLYSDLEHNLKAEFQRMMQELRENRNTALLEIRKQKEREVELKTEYIAVKELEVEKINEKIKFIETYRNPLSHLSNAFERKRFVDQLPAIEDELKQLANINDVTIFYEADVSEWTAKMVAWQNDVSKAIARTTDALPIFSAVSSPTSSMVFRRSTITRSVTSVTYDSDISISWEKKGLLELVSNRLSSHLSMSSMSIFGNVLLISRIGDRYVYVYNTHDRLQPPQIAAHNKNTVRVRAAVWTREGHIVYTTNNTKQVVVMTQIGEVEAQTPMTDPQHLTGSIHDDVIYLADYENGLQQSVDGGRTWKLLFKPCSGGSFVQAVKVTTDRDIDEFWIIEDIKSDTKPISVVSLGDNSSQRQGSDSDSFELVSMGQSSRLDTCLLDDLQLDNNCRASSPYYGKKTRLSIYKRDRRGAVVRNVVSLPSQPSIDLAGSRLAYDGRTSIFLSDYNNRAVHVWSVNGQYDRQLLSSVDFTSKPTFLTVDEQRRLIYVAQSDSTIKVFRLTYSQDADNQSTVSVEESRNRADRRTTLVKKLHTIKS